MRRTTRLAATVLTMGIASVACAGDDEPAPAAEGEPGAVRIENFLFVPEMITVRAGTTVTWTNGDDAPHTVEGEGDAFAESPRLDRGGTFSHTFSAPGRINYLCGIHNYMRATVVVT